MGNGHVGTVGRKRVGWIERVTLTYTCHPVLNRQRVGSCCVDRELSSGLCDDPEGWMGLGGRLQREGIHVYLQPIHIVVRQKPATL